MFKCLVSRSESRKRVLNRRPPVQPKTLLLTFNVRFLSCACVHTCKYASIYFIPQPPDFCAQWFSGTATQTRHRSVEQKKKKKRRARGLRVVRGEGENVSPRIMGMKEEAGRVAKLQRTLRRPHLRVQSHCENK